LPGGQVRRRRYPAREQESVRLQVIFRDPVADGFAGLVGDLELDRAMRLLLHDDGSGQYVITLLDIAHAKSHEVAAAELAVDCQVEEGEIPGLLGELQAEPDGPDILQAQGRLLSKQLSPIPRGMGGDGGDCHVHGGLLQKKEPSW